MESEFKKDLNPAPKSKPARLCITVDKFFKLVHIKIISNELRDYNRYCRNEAADALLHQTPDILQRRVVSFEFQDPKMIPPISPDNNDSYLKQIREMSKHPNNHISIMYDKYLRDDIGLFISKVPRQHLISRYGIVPDSPHTINIPELYDGTNKPLVRDVLLHNNFLDCELIESPQSSWLFTDTDSGIKQMSAFYALLNKHFFDPRMDIDRLTISTVWVDRDNMPRQANKFTVDDSSKDHLLLANAIEAEKIPIREKSVEHDFSPYPENYWRFFSEYPNDPLNRSDEIAWLLFAESTGIIVEKDEYHDYSYIDRFENLKERQYNTSYIDEKMEIEKQLKTLAGEILRQEGFVIRGRELEPAVSIDENLIPENRPCIHL